jgi:hypothetical protein
MLIVEVVEVICRFTALVLVVQKSPAAHLGLIATTPTIGELE